METISDLKQGDVFRHRRSVFQLIEICCEEHYLRLVVNLKCGNVYSLNASYNQLHEGTLVTKLKKIKVSELK